MRRQSVALQELAGADVLQEREGLDVVAQIVAIVGIDAVR
jgi:hypothetical protein